MDMLQNDFHNKADNIFILSQKTFFFVCMVITFKFYSLKNQAYNAVLLIIVTMLYIRSTDLIDGICIL